MKKNAINFLKFMNLVPIVDLGFRKPSTVNPNVPAPCICPFHANFFPLCEKILPNHITNADVFCNPSCTSKEHVFRNKHDFVEHLKRSSRDWHHAMLLHFLSLVHDDPDILEDKKRKGKGKKRKNKRG